MKKERKILLALLLIFVCGLAFLVYSVIKDARHDIVVYSNGEEIVPYQNKIALSVFLQDDNDAECEWLKDDAIKQSIPELTYAEDFNIKCKNADKYSYVLNVYNPRGKCVQKEIDISAVSSLRAGTYYIGIVRQEQNGEYVENSAGMICEYLFKMKKPSKAAEGEPRVTIVSNGEEIRPFSESLTWEKWAPIGTWVTAKLIQRWPKDKSVVSEFPVVTYAEDFEIRVRDDTSFSETFKIYKSVDDMAAQVGDKSYLAKLPAGTYYIYFTISYHSGDWMETEHGAAGYEESGSSQCLFTLIKEDDKEEIEKDEKETVDKVSREVPIVSQNGKQTAITHSYFLHASSYSNGYWLAVDGGPLRMAYSPEDNNLIEIEYSDDISILYEDEMVSYSQLNVYEREMKLYERSVSVKNFGALPAGTYYIGIVISSTGEYIEDEKYPGYESSTSEYVFKLVKPPTVTQEEPLVYVYSNGEQILPYQHFQKSDFRGEEAYWQTLEGEPLPPHFPVIEYSTDFCLQYEEGADFSYLSVYNSEFNLKYTVMDAESLTFLNTLPPDTYYIGIAVTQQDNADAVNYEQLFTLIKPSEPALPTLPEPPATPIEQSNTVAFSAPVYLYSYEELEQAIADSYSGQNSYSVQQTEHYYIPTYAEKYCELTRIAVSNHQFIQRYQLKDSADSAQADFILEINMDKSSAQTNMSNMVQKLNAKAYSLYDADDIEQIFYSEGNEKAMFCWMQDEYFFMLTVSAELLKQIRENDFAALKGSLFELEQNVFQISEEDAHAAAGLIVQTHEDLVRISDSDNPMHTRVALNELEYYYIPTYVEKWCSLPRTVFYGDADGIISRSYNDSTISSETFNIYAVFEFEREGNCGEDYLETAIRRYDLQPYEACEGVYYIEHYSTYFFWLHEGHAFMLTVYPEFMEYLKANDPEALKGALFELEKVTLEPSAPESTTGESAAPQENKLQNPEIVKPSSPLTTTIAFSAPMHLTSFEDLEQVKREYYSGNDDNYGLWQIEHYYIPVYAEKWCEMTRISANYALFILEYRLREYSDAERKDFELYINIHKESAAAEFQEIIARKDIKPYEPYEGMYYFEAVSGLMRFYWMQNGDLFRLELSPALMAKIKDNDPQALNGSLFGLVKAEFLVPEEDKAVAAGFRMSSYEDLERSKNSRNAWRMDSLSHYYIPVYADEQVELMYIKAYGDIDGVLQFYYNDPATKDIDFIFEYDREAGRADEFWETAIRRYKLQPYEHCEGVYYAQSGNRYYFFWLYEGYSFMLRVSSEFMEYLNENDPEALKGALFELERVEL